MQCVRHSFTILCAPAGEWHCSCLVSSLWTLRQGEVTQLSAWRRVLQLQQHGRWTAAMTVCSGLLILLVLGKRREMLAHTFGPTRMLLPVSSSCTPRNCTDVPGAPLPLCPHEGLRSKDMRRISAQDLSTPDSPSFQLYSSLISFRWRSWDFNMQLICLTDRHSFLPHWNSSVKINHLIVHPPEEDVTQLKLGK